MINKTIKSYEFAKVHIKQEGAPAHPDDVFTHCGCEKCDEKYEKQLKTYEDYFNGLDTLYKTIAGEL